MLTYWYPRGCHEWNYEQFTLYHLTSNSCGPGLVNSSWSDCHGSKREKTKRVVHNTHVIMLLIYLQISILAKSGLDGPDFNKKCLLIKTTECHSCFLQATAFCKQGDRVQLKLFLMLALALAPLRTCQRSDPAFLCGPFGGRFEIAMAVTFMVIIQRGEVPYLWSWMMMMMVMVVRIL